MKVAPPPRVTVPEFQKAPPIVAPLLVKVDPPFNVTVEPEVL
jgi:hypothetical protein